MFNKKVFFCFSFYFISNYVRTFLRNICVYDYYSLFVFMNTPKSKSVKPGITSYVKLIKNNSKISYFVFYIQFCGKIVCHSCANFRFYAM